VEVGAVATGSGTLPVRFTALALSLPVVDTVGVMVKVMRDRPLVTGCVQRRRGAAPEPTDAAAT